MKKIFFLLIFIFIISPIQLLAAEFYFDDRISEMGIGQTAEVGVFLNTEDQVINAVEGVIKIDPNFEVRAITLNNSFIPLWIEQPKITSTRTVKFAGIVPGGFTDSYGLLFSLILEARIPGEAGAQILNPRVLAHDGLGTDLPAKVKPLSIDIGLDKKDVRQWNLQYDIDVPEEFFPEIIRDESLFDNQWFVVFNTQDKESGINHYEIQETKLFDSEKINNLDSWKLAVSPYVLEDQSRSSYVMVKAVDNNGNARIANIKPLSLQQESQYQSYSWYQSLIWIILVVVLIIIFYKIFKKKKIN